LEELNSIGESQELALPMEAREKVFYYVKGRIHLGDLGLNENIILKLI
jgi:hypothetical protein